MDLRRPPSSFSFSRLAIGILLYNASGGVLYAVLPLFEFQQKATSQPGYLTPAVLATLIVGAPLLATTLGSFTWGGLSDRWGRRRELLAAGVLAQSVLFLLLPFLAPVALLVVRVGQAFVGSSASLATTQATEDPRRTAGSGLGGLSFWGSIGSVVGILVALPFLGGAQFSAQSSVALGLFVLLGALSATSVIFLVATGEIDRKRSTTSWRGLFRFQDGRAVLHLCGATAIIGAGNYIVYTLFPLWVNWAITPSGVLGPGVNSTQQLAVLSIGAAMGGVVVSLWAGRVAEGWTGRRRLYLAAPLVYAVLWLGLAFVRLYPLVFLIWSVPVYVILSVPVLREISGRTLPEERGRAVGLWSAAFSLGGLGGTLLAGWAYRGPGSFGVLFGLAAAIDLVSFAAFALAPTQGHRARESARTPSGAPEDG